MKKENLLQVYYIAIMLGANVDIYEINEEKNCLWNKEENKEAGENDLTFILDCIENNLENNNDNYEN